MDTPRRETDPATITMINALFDAIKEANGLSSDSALARHIDVPDMYVWRWRRGEVSASFKVLAPLLVTYAERITAAQIAA